MVVVVIGGVVVLGGGVVVGGVVVAAAVSTGALSTGCDDTVSDLSPHETARPPSAATSATLRRAVRVLLMRKVLPRCSAYVGSFTTASPSRSMSARSQ